MEEYANLHNNFTRKMFSSTTLSRMMSGNFIENNESNSEMALVGLRRKFFCVLEAFPMPENFHEEVFSFQI